MIPRQIPEGNGYRLFHFNIVLLIVDYYSKYPKVFPIQMKTAEATIAASKRYIFAKHGIPSKLIADNMPFNSKQFVNDSNLEIIIHPVQHIHSQMDLLNAMFKPLRSF